MRIPGAEQAVVDIRKLQDYCLSPDHPRGRHKARVFAATLGLTMENAEELRQALLTACSVHDAIQTGEDQYGARYVIDFVLSRGGRAASIRSSWIIRSAENFPRLTSCYVIRE